MRGECDGYSALNDERRSTSSRDGCLTLLVPPDTLDESSRQPIQPPKKVTTPTRLHTQNLGARKLARERGTGTYPRSHCPSYS